MTLKELSEKFEKYVTIERFSPVEKLVYGATALILTGVIIALISLVIKK